MIYILCSALDRLEGKGKAVLLCPPPCWWRAQIYTTTWLSRGQKFTERHGRLQGNLQPFPLEMCLFHLISCRNKIRSCSLMPKVVYLSRKLILQTEERPAASCYEFVIYNRPSSSSSFFLLTTSAAPAPPAHSSPGQEPTQRDTLASAARKAEPSCYVSKARKAQ